MSPEEEAKQFGEDIHKIAKTLAEPLGMLFEVGNLGTVPNVVVAALATSLVDVLRQVAVLRGRDGEEWDQRVKSTVAIVNAAVVPAVGGMRGVTVMDPPTGEAN